MGYFKINKLRFKLLIMESEKVQVLLLKLKSTELSSLQQNLFAAFCNIKTDLWIFWSIHLFLTIVTSSIIMVVKDKRQKRELSHLFLIQGHFPAESLCVFMLLYNHSHRAKDAYESRKSIRKHVSVFLRRSIHQFN